jgi:hypothetical protein
MGMTRKFIFALSKTRERPSISREDRMTHSRGLRTRRDFLTMAFGYTAAIAVAGIPARAHTASDDVFDGGEP